MTVLPALPPEVIAALEAAHFEPDPFSHDWHRSEVETDRGEILTALNPWDRLDGDHEQLVGRRVEYRYGPESGIRWIVSEHLIRWRSYVLARAIHDWQQTLPESESAL